MKDIFLVEKSILDDEGMSLPSVQQTTQTQARTCTDVFGRQAVGLGKGSAWEKGKENIFSFSVFPVTPRLA